MKNKNKTRESGEFRHVCVQLRTSEDEKILIVWRFIQLYHIENGIIRSVDLLNLATSNVPSYFGYSNRLYMRAVDETLSIYLFHSFSADCHRNRKAFVEITPPPCYYRLSHPHMHTQTHAYAAAYLLGVVMSAKQYNTIQCIHIHTI